MNRTPWMILRPAAFLALAILPLLPASAADPKSGPKPTPAPPIYDSFAIASREIEFTKEVCSQTNRRMLVNFGTNDCAACRVVNHAIHEKKFFDALIRQFVPVFVDVTPGSKNAELLKDYRIDPKKGLPAFVIFDNEFKFLERSKDGELAAIAKKGDEAVQAWILSRFYKDSEDH